MYREVGVLWTVFALIDYIDFFFEIWFMESCLWIYDQFYVQWWTIIKKLIEASTLVIFYFFPLFFIEAIKEI